MKHGPSRSRRSSWEGALQQPLLDVQWRHCIEAFENKRMSSPLGTPVVLFVFSVPTLCLLGSGLRAQGDPLERRFAAAVRPFLERHCHSCHGPKKPKAGLDLSRDVTVAAVAKNVRQWGMVLERLQAQEMPPEDAPRRPTPEERAAVVAWLRDLRDREAQRTAGDPGMVLARRLSNAELDCTIRDLTGVDIRPTREFPVDPANEAGFDNSGESLAMSPALLKKYLAAARLVADHVVLEPEGFVFAPHPAVTDTDRDKYCVRRIIDFYERHKVDYADYFLAAWRFEHREALGKPKAVLADFAAAAGLSPRYLEAIRSLLHEAPSGPGPLADVQAQWRQMPADAQQQEEARRECERLRDLVVGLRKGFAPRVEKLTAKGISPGSQPFVLWRNRQLAAQHLRPPEEGKAAGKDVARFCRVFPDTFAVIERAPYYDPGSSPRGRLLSAGFHLMHGYFRDDGPLCEWILDERQRREIDALWDELDFVTLSPLRQYKDFIFFERAEPPRFLREAEFDFARSEDKDATSEAKLDRLAKAYLARARKLGAGAQALEAIETYFTGMSAAIRRVERARLAAESSHLEALVQFAGRAYRRPLTDAERDGLLAFYRSLRRKDDLGHEEALRDTLVTVLLSPHFCYRIDLAEPGPAARPLSDYALASRLSYFLWSSMPDRELLGHAAAGDLHRPEVLTAQARRMLRDPRVRGLATEFAGNWLDFRRFEEHNAVDRQRFPTFTNELRQAMFEEPIRYFIDIARRDRSVLDLLYGNDTFVNRPLARLYGMPEPPSPPTPLPRRERGESRPPLSPLGRGIGGEGEWVHVPDAQRYGRGGLLPMAVFLTKNAPGLRTSPVKRGYWVVRRLLGETIPPPPPAVPELPRDEASLGELTLPQVLARHRDNKSCAACHRRFDSVGLVFEGFGPVGERRTKDLGGRSVQTAATFPDGKERSGLKGLRDYLREKRQDDFIDNLCRKLFSYALGRSLQLSDQKALEAMRTRLGADGFQFGSLVEAIVTSPQFRTKRGRDEPAGP
jgi:mono/diheme cytochrome c family protein